MNLSVIAWNERAYEALVHSLSTGKVRMFLDDLLNGSILRYELPNISSLNFVYVQSQDETANEDITLNLQRITDKFMEMEIEVNDHESEN